MEQNKLFQKICLLSCFQPDFSIANRPRDYTSLLSMDPILSA